MDALMAAIVAALLVQASDRMPWAAARLGDAYAQTGGIVAGTALVVVLGNGAAAIGGAFVAPLLSPKAADLLLALALLSGGIAGFRPVARAKVAARRGGAFIAGTVAIGLTALGDRMQFVTAALAGRSTTPTLAAAGACFGTLAVAIPAILLGERGLRRLPTTALRIAAAAMLTIAGVVQGLGALRLI